MSEAYKLSEFGDIPVSWQILKLSDITSLIKDGTHGTHKNFVGGIPLLSAKDIYNGKINIPANCRRISKEDYLSIHRNFDLKEKDILLTVVGTIGRVALLTDIKNKYTFQRSVAYIRFKSDQYPEYYYHLFSSDYFIKQLDLHSNASAQAGIYLGSLGKIKVFSPTLCEQKKIAEILSTVDEKIELIDAQINQTKELKKGLMQQLLTKGIGHTLFKSSVLGDIPDNWEVVKLLDITSLIKDGTHGSHKDVKCGIPLLSAKDIYNGKVHIPVNCRRISKEDYLSIHKNFILNEKDILITIVGTIGRIALLTDTVNKYTFQRSVGYIRLKSDQCPEYYYHLFSSDYFRKQLDLNSNASAQAGVYLSSLGKMNVLSPTRSEQQKIAKILSTVDEKIDLFIAKKQAYQNLKKGLMEQLLTGKIRVNLYQEESAVA